MKRQKFTLLTALWMAVGLFGQHDIALGQCTLACDSPDPSAAAEVAVNQNCEAVISANSLLQGTTTCAGPFDLLATDMLGNVVASGTDLITIGSAWLGTTLQVQITDQPSGNSCMSYVMLVDNLPPTFDACPNDTVVCTAPLDPASIAAVAVSDNCDASLGIQQTTSQLGPDCNLPNNIIAVFVRNWTATDDFGNSSTCQQLIFVEKPDMTAVQFPPDLTLECSVTATDPSVTGQPTLGGYPLSTFSPCQISVNYTDTEQELCGASHPARQIVRAWEVWNDCNDEILRDTQLILLLDTVPPVLACADVTVGTDTLNCTGTFMLPQPMATDNCGTDLVYDAVLNAPGAIGSGLGPYSGVSPGTYSVTYIVEDECGNIATCMANVMLVDDDPPQAVCDEITNVSLGPTGDAIVFAATFDDGSYDNCAPIDFLVSRDGVNFGPTVTFSCNDLQQNPIMVIVRVYDVTNPTSWSDCLVEVEVEDKIFPVLSCPPDLTVDCQADLSDLSVFGSPIVDDNCGYTLSETDSITTGACGTGTVWRTFVAIDSSGNVSTCTQTITLENQNPFDGASIVWPQDYTVENACMAVDAFHPDSLPSGYDWPQWPFAPCSMIAISYEDQLFQIAYPACYKIFRKWTIIDWCQYDFNNPTGPGRWEYTQLIKVLDTEPPVVTQCPVADTFGIDANCEWGDVQLPMVVADDCSPELIITNNSPWATSGGADASGLYPAGTHEVVFTIMDGCGNTSYCITTVTVSDLKKPTPYCNTGIVAELQEMNGTIMAILDAEMLDFDSYDNCTASSDLQFFVRRVQPNSMNPPTTTQLMFDCNDIGVQLVELWVVDQTGNADYCITQMIVQDNMNVCPPLSMAVVGGEIENEEGEMVDEVTVYMQSTSPAFPSFSTTGGSYAFPNLPIGLGYEVIPEKNIDPLNGITTFDLVLIKRHILGMDTLDTPYKIIAADANGSGTVTTADIVLLTKMVLGQLQELPNMPAWRFVPQAYQFADPLHPFAEDFPELIEIPNLSSDWLDANFVAIKVGDVNCSAIPNALVASENRTMGTKPLRIEEPSGQAQQQWLMPIYLEDLSQLAAIQFTLEFDPALLSFDGVESGQIDPDVQQLNLSQLDEGIIGFIWYDEQGVQVDTQRPLFFIRWRVKRTMQRNYAIHLSDRLVTRALYDPEGTTYEPFLIGSTKGQPSSPIAEQVELLCNPVQSEIPIRYVLAQSGSVRFSIATLRGQTIWEQSFDQKVGTHTLTLPISEHLMGPGVYLVCMQTPTGQYTKKLVVVQ